MFLMGYRCDVCGAEAWKTREEQPVAMFRVEVCLVDNGRSRQFYDYERAGDEQRGRLGGSTNGSVAMHACPKCLRSAPLFKHLAVGSERSPEETP